jgi:hypothetical protein
VLGDERVGLLVASVVYSDGVALAAREVAREVRPHDGQAHDADVGDGGLLGWSLLASFRSRTCDVLRLGRAFMLGRRFVRCLRVVGGDLGGLGGIVRRHEGS